MDTDSLDDTPQATSEPVLGIVKRSPVKFYSFKGILEPAKLPEELSGSKNMEVKPQKSYLELEGKERKYFENVDGLDPESWTSSFQISP